MFLKIFLSLLALSQLVVGLEIRQLQATVTVEPSYVARQNPCDRVNARPFETNPRGCSWFWECVDDSGNKLVTPVEGKCPYDLYFDAVAQTCTYSSNVVAPCSYDEDNSITPTKCEEFQPMRLIPHPTDCQKYFMCWENKTVERSCEVGQHFSYFDNGCVSEFLADCRAVDNYCKSVGPAVRALRSVGSCTKYHICSHCNDRYSLTELECAASFQFNETLGHCDVATSVNCVIPPVDELPNFPNVISFECPSTEFSYEAHPDSTYCEFFFICSNGRSILQRCPAGSHFDTEANWCVPHTEPFTCPSPSNNLFGF